MILSGDKVAWTVKRAGAHGQRVTTEISMVHRALDADTYCGLRLPAELNVFPVLANMETCDKCERYHAAGFTRDEITTLIARAS